MPSLSVRRFLTALFATFILQGLIPVANASAITTFHTVTLVENDNSTDPVYSSQTASAPTPLTTFANLNPTFVNSGFSLLDWNTAPDGSGTSYLNGSTYSFTSDVVLYAIWVGNFYTVSFVENDNPSDPI